MPQLSQPNIIHFQLAVSFIIPFINLWDSARSQSKLSAVCRGRGGEGSLDVLCVGPVAVPLPCLGQFSSRSHDCVGDCCVLTEMHPFPLSLHASQMNQPELREH